MTWEEVFHISNNSGYILEIFIAEAVFCFYLKKRSYFWLRYLLTLPLYLFLALVIPNCVAHFTSGFYSLTIFLISLPFYAFAFDCSFKEVLFCCLGAQLAQNLSYNLEMLIFLPLQGYFNTWSFGALAIGMEALTYLFCFFVFVKRMKGEDGVPLFQPYLFVVEVLVCFFVYTVQWLYTVYGVDQYWIARLPLIFVCVLGLSFQSGLLVYKKKEQENSELERLIVDQGKQYKTALESVNVINMKAHDLKHYLNQVRSEKDNPSDLSEIENAVTRYESTIQTGNKVADIILTDKSYLCEMYHIPFHVMADDIKLQQVAVNDVASIFGNALDNAIDYEKRIADESKRYIGFRAQRKNDLISLHFENYCPDALVFKNGFPETTKADKANHGFGFKSMEYVAKKYGGYLTVGLQNNLFAVDIVMPNVETSPISTKDSAR